MHDIYSMPGQRRRGRASTTPRSSSSTARKTASQRHLPARATAHPHRHASAPSGLWRALTPEDFKTLLLLLTFVTPNGWCRPTLPELADAMQVSHAKARARLERLTGMQWQGQPLAELLARPDGLDAYLPGRRLVAHEDAPARSRRNSPRRSARRAGRR